MLEKVLSDTLRLLQIRHAKKHCDNNYNTLQIYQNRLLIVGVRIGKQARDVI